jgi:CMP-N,N'-diacetyllegionaminic acid synthase
MINGKRVIGVTLARGGSKGIPNKNIYKINGKPLIAYTILEALKSKYIDKYIVSTDCKKIADIAEKYGAEVPFLRPKELATDNSTSADALLHAVNWIEGNGDEYDLVIELMATNPLKNASHIDEVLELRESLNCPYCVAVQKLSDHHPARIKYIENRMLKDFFPEVLESRRQDLKPDAYIRAGSIYCMTTSVLKQTNARYGNNNTAAYILPDSAVVNIDEPIDLKVAENMILEREHNET